MPVHDGSETIFSIFPLPASRGFQAFGCRLSACLPGCLRVCLSACLPVCLLHKLAHWHINHETHTHNTNTYIHTHIYIYIYVYMDSYPSPIAATNICNISSFKNASSTSGQPGRRRRSPERQAGRLGGQLGQHGAWWLEVECWILPRDMMILYIYIYMYTISISISISACMYACMHVM